ncbi:response regulator [Dyadobacter jiangsuensis]|uniref:LuxR family two component transcriptional regulator n=1 Tax=Dyadobacter jiangsuensis TaxID=1591085 RepID=A0A2P8F945_9BACT|nr:response regulator transcription factor [Dyadobacter jiangsuensis]PSL18243.1 LuxR family two component transcriptional regulator [Dyadobacter jiangsuensis]
MNQLTRILLVDDHELVLWALVAIIREKLPDTQVLSASSFDQGFETIKNTPVDLIILDIDVPGGNSTKMIEKLKSVRADIRVLIHTAMEEEDYSIKYLTAGADGFLSKASPLPTVAEAIQTVLRGEKYMSPKTQNLLANSYLKSVTNPAKPKEASTITPREAEIITLLLQGKWTKEIASQLGIKWSTVSTHKLSIFEKFGVTNVIQLYKKILQDYPDLIDVSTTQVKPKS